MSIGNTPNTVGKLKSRRRNPDEIKKSAKQCLKPKQLKVGILEFKKTEIGMIITKISTQTINLSCRR